MLHIYRQITALGTLPAGCHRAKARGSGAVSLRSGLRGGKTGDAFSAALLVSHTARRALADFARGNATHRTSALRERRAAPAHLFRAHRGPSPAADAALAEADPSSRFMARMCWSISTSRAIARATREMLAAARLVLVRSRIARARGRRTWLPVAKRSGCTAPAFRWTKSLSRHASGLTTAAWRFLQAGRLIEKKGFADESARLRCISGDRIPARSSRSRAKDRCGTSCANSARANWAIADRVRFAGFLSQAELREQFYRSHIFLHPSELGADGNQEGVPNAMLEAMASGLPVFATSHGGIPEAIEHGMSGVLVDERDHAALAEALLDWTERSGSSERSWRRTARRAVAEKFEQRAQARALEDIYFEALGRGLDRTAFRPRLGDNPREDRRSSVRRDGARLLKNCCQLRGDCRRSSTRSRACSCDAIDGCGIKVGIAQQVRRPARAIRLTNDHGRRSPEKRDAQSRRRRPHKACGRAAHRPRPARARRSVRLQNDLVPRHLGEVIAVGQPFFEHRGANRRGRRRARPESCDSASGLRSKTVTGSPRLAAP